MLTLSTPEVDGASATFAPHRTVGTLKLMGCASLIILLVYEFDKTWPVVFFALCAST